MKQQRSGDCLSVSEFSHSGWVYKNKSRSCSGQFCGTFGSKSTKWNKYTLNLLFGKTLKQVQGDSNLFVIPNCLGFCFTKSRCSLHFVVVRLTFCSLVSTLPLRTTQNPLVSESVYLQNLLNIVETDSSPTSWVQNDGKGIRHTEALAEVSFFGIFFS